MRDRAISFGYLEAEQKVVLFMLSGDHVDLSHLFTTLEPADETKTKVRFAADFDAIVLREEV